MIFPRTKFVSLNGLHQQMEHVTSELEELFAAYHSDPIERVAEEAADLLHSVETLCRILQEKRLVNMDVIVAQVIEKNRARGYYDNH